MAKTAVVNLDKCVGCSLCTKICPTGTLSMDKESKKAYNTGVFCDEVWGCIKMCPVDAITIGEVSNEIN